MIDPLLPPRPDIPEGEPLTAITPDGQQATGVLYRHDGGHGLWQPRQTWELTPLEGGSAAMSGLLGALRRRLDREAADADSACVVTWPSRDVAAAGALLDHGLVPSALLGVRQRGPVEAPPRQGVTVRPATAADVPALTGLWLQELHYSALASFRVPRPDARPHVRALLERALTAGEPVRLAESDGVPVGLAVCGAPAPVPRRLTPGTWAAVEAVSVAETARGTGVGRALMAAVHGELLGSAVHGTYLFYSPHNALSSVFWHRQGYRPVWTTWEVRPAGALRQGMAGEGMGWTG